MTGEVIDQSRRWGMLLDALSTHKRLSVTEAAERLRGHGAARLKEFARQQLATRTHGGVVATTVAYDLPARYRIAPATRVSGSLVPRPNWSGPEKRERDLRRGGRQLRAPRRVRHQRRDGFPDAARHHGGRFTEDRGSSPLARICTIDQVDGLVTDDVADPDQVCRLRDAGVNVTLVL